MNNSYGKGHLGYLISLDPERDQHTLIYRLENLLSVFTDLSYMLDEDEEDPYYELIELIEYQLKSARENNTIINLDGIVEKLGAIEK